MSQFFHSWIFWFLIGLVIVYILCKHSLKKDEERKKQQRILWENGIFGVDVTKDLKMQGAPFFKCCAEVYNQALNMILIDNQTTITIQGVQYKYKRNLNAFKVYERVTNKGFTLSDIHNVYVLMHCLLVVNNPNMNLRLDEFLSYVEETETKLDRLNNSSKKSKRKRHRHIPDIFKEQTERLLHSWSETEVETSSID